MALRSTTAVLRARAYVGWSHTHSIHVDKIGVATAHKPFYVVSTQVFSPYSIAVLGSILQLFDQVTFVLCVQI